MEKHHLKFKKYLTVIFLIELYCAVCVSAQLRDAVIIESSTASSNMQAKRVLFGFLNECSNSASATAASDADSNARDAPFGGNIGNSKTPLTNTNSNNSFVLDVYKRLTNLEEQYAALQNTLKQLTATCNYSRSVALPVFPSTNQSSTSVTDNYADLNETMSERVERSDWATSKSPADRYVDYKHIADMRPVFWLSGHYFDGFKLTNASVRTGVVRRRTDVVGNAVVQSLGVPVIDDNGHSAYTFFKNNSISATIAVNTHFTFVAAFRFPVSPVGSEGRFFTSPVGNRLFAGHAGFTQRWYMGNAWVNVQSEKSTEVEVLLGTNDNGVKNLMTHNLNLIVNTTSGDNIWGHTIIGLPTQFANEAARVNVYEVLVFDKVLSVEQQNYVLSVLKKWFNLTDK